MEAHLLAFLFTVAVEIPIYAVALRRRFPSLTDRVAGAFGLSAITHPSVWFVFSGLGFDRWIEMLVAAEAFAVGVEAAALHLSGARRALLLALGANAASLGLGLASRAAFGVP